jgi:putative polyhydroxyalkanoate system protein
MATIDVRRKHTMPMGDAKGKAEELARSFEAKLGIRWRWEGEGIKFDAVSGAAKGVKGEVGVTSSEIRVQIDLPLLLRPIKGVVEGKVKENLDRVVGPA